MAYCLFPASWRHRLFLIAPILLLVLALEAPAAAADSSSGTRTAQAQTVTMPAFPFMHLTDADFARMARSTSTAP